MNVLWKKLKEFLKENFNEEELRTLIKLMDAGEGLSTFRDALESALESKENSKGEN